MKVTKTTMVVAGLALLAVSVSVAGAAEKVTLKERYASGAYLMTTKMTMDQTVTAGGTEQPAMHMEQLMAMKLDISQPDAKGNKKMVITYERIKVQAEAGGEGKTYDSDEPAEKQDPSMAQTLDILRKARIEVTIDRDDKFVTASGLDKLWDELAKDNELMGPALEQMKAQLGDKMIKDMLKQSQVMLPKEPVAEGAEWKNDMELDMPVVGKTTVSMECKLDSVKKSGGSSVATISWTGTISAKDSTTQVMGADATISKMDFKQVGMTRFDVEKGALVASDVSQTGTIDVSVAQPDGQTTPIKIDQKVKMTTTFEPYQAKEKATPARSQ